MTLAEFEALLRSYHGIEKVVWTPDNVIVHAKGMEINGAFDPDPWTRLPTLEALAEHLKVEDDQ